jgi:Mrp family chromosome partitioning ATPase
VALETEYARLSREAAEARERFQQLESRQFMASMTASTLTSGQAAQIVVIDPAYLPANPVGMRVVRLYGLGGALSLLLALGVLAALALLDDRIHDSADVERLPFVSLLVEIDRRNGGAGGSTAGRDARRDARAKELQGDRAAAGVTRFSTEGTGEPTRRLGALPAMTVVAPTSATASALATRRRDPGEDVDGREASVADIGGAGRVRVHELAGGTEPDPSVVMLTAPDSPAAAGFRILRHRIADRGNPGVVLVTSPRTGDGKTWCAANLALAMAEGDRTQVLLLEANFRNPSLSRLLGIQPPISLEKQLEFYRAMRLHSWDVAQTEVPGLHAMAIAPDGVEPPVLDGPSLAACVADLGRAGYGRVVVDGPAILGSADANLVEEGADGIVIVLHAGTSRVRELKKAIEQIGAPKVLGVVLVRA